MTEVSRTAVENALRQIEDFYIGKNLIDAGEIASIKIENDMIDLHIVPGYPSKNYRPKLEQEIRQKILRETSAKKVTITFEDKIVAHAVQKNLKPLSGIKNIIAIASGKGGVGKSTTAVNLALALVAEGAQVGILDADIYGPSQPRMLGIEGKPESKDGKMLEPMQHYDIKAMSIGFLIDEETPMIWRGPMVTQALEQLLSETRWGDLDYLIIDLPPGTGDIQLTLAQKIPVSGAVIVTTPQDIALLDAKKALRMFEKVDVPVLGIVENMSIHICSNCGHEEHIFGYGGGEKMASDYQVPLLGALPLDIRIREEADMGKPTVIANPNSRITEMYCEIARHTAAQLAQNAKDYSSKFPNIVIRND